MYLVASVALHSMLPGVHDTGVTESARADSSFELQLHASNARGMMHMSVNVTVMDVLLETIGRSNPLVAERTSLQ